MRPTGAQDLRPARAVHRLAREHEEVRMEPDDVIDRTMIEELDRLTDEVLEDELRQLWG